MLDVQSHLSLQDLFPLASFLQVLDLIDQFIYVSKLAIDGGKADVGHFV
jgi:hypothetical protein